ncbi:MAG: hypothetical protein C5B51_15920 [Terriglobia bacterium]|nr:MAG: hypothetical protein C5B51_15920 [Terriglobia bacterium]
MKFVSFFCLLAALTVAAANAQVDFTGEWAPLYHEDGPERGPGPELGDYTEFPINDAARMRADSYDADRISVVQEYQCRPHGADYALRGLGQLRIWRDIDPATQRTTAFHLHFLAWDSERTIYLDDRPHPPDYALHTFQGFSTAVWEGNMLTVTTTNLKANYLRRNGLPRSDKAILTEHWTKHGDYLTITTVIEDPVFLTEPLVRSDNWYIDPGQHIGIFGCEYAAEVPKPEGAVPHHLPGANTNLREFANWYGLPFEATRGGAETLYPEYRSKITPYNPPAKCTRYCNCTSLFNCNVDSR